MHLSEKLATLQQGISFENSHGVVVGVGSEINPFGQVVVDDILNLVINLFIEAKEVLGEHLPGKHSSRVERW